MNCILEGKKVTGHYLGHFFVSGTVLESRVGVSDIVQHYVELDETLTIGTQSRRRIILEDSDISYIDEPDQEEEFDV